MPTRSMVNCWLPMLLSAALLSGVAGNAAAQWQVSEFTIDGGGGTRSTGGAFGVGGTIGQPDAGRLSGSIFTLLGGFWSGGGAVTGVADGDDAARPILFRMHPASPNPLSERTQVAFDLPGATVTRVALYDAAGRLIRVLAEEPFAAGKHLLSWDRRDQSGRSVSAGVYFLRLDAGSDRSRQKLVVMH